MGFIKDMLFKAGTTAATMIWPVEDSMNGVPVRAQWDSYDTFVKEGYLKNGVVYACINKLSNAVASVPWHIRDKESGKILHDHHIEKLFQHKANPLNSFSVVAGMWVHYLMLSGNSYLWKNTVDKGRKVQELYSVRPDRMSIIPGGRGIAAYRYDPKASQSSSTNLEWLLSLGKGMGGEFALGDGMASVKGTQAVNFRVDAISQHSDITHFKFLNPLDDFYGLSPVKAAADDIDLYNSFTDYNKRLMKNDARPSGIVIAKQKLSQPEMERIKTYMRDNVGIINAGRFLLFDSDITWQQLGLTPKDIDYQGGKNSVARDIAVQFLTPPQIVNIEGKETFSNKKEALIEFWDTGVIPLLNSLGGELKWLLDGVPHGDELEIFYDASRSPAIIAKRANLWKLTSEVKDIATTNERRALVNLPAISGGDHIMVPSSLITLGNAVENNPGGQDNAEEE